MKIVFGSKNPAKLAAVQEILPNYPLFHGAIIEGRKVASGVTNQPTTLDETLKGAKERAKNAYVDCDYSIATEDGLLAFPGTKSGYMNLCVCAIYDGTTYHLGASSLFEYPKEMIRLILQEGMELSDVARILQLPFEKRIGDEGGIIGVLTKGRLVRAEYTKEAIRNALIHLENPELYGS